MRLEAKQQRVLDFDIEVRPIAWYGGDWVTKQPTCIAWKFVGEPGEVQYAIIGESDRSSQVFNEEVDMLLAFEEAYDAADVVTGHFIRGFDLPIINARRMGYQMPLLRDKLTSDTKGDLASAQGMSKSQENLGAMFELEHPKVPMNTTKWEYANVLSYEGIVGTIQRCTGDVEQHIELRDTMLSLGYLSRPKLWTARGGSVEAYTP